MLADFVTKSLDGHNPVENMRGSVMTVFEFYREAGKIQYISICK